MNTIQRVQLHNYNHSYVLRVTTIQRFNCKKHATVHCIEGERYTEVQLQKTYSIRLLY